MDTAQVEGWGEVVGELISAEDVKSNLWVLVQIASGGKWKVKDQVQSPERSLRL